MVKELSYNLRDQPILETDGLGNRTAYEYRPDERLTQVHRGGKEASRRLQSFEYNARGQITGIVDGMGEPVRYEADSWGRITQIRFSDGVKEAYEYTPAGLVKSSTDGRGNRVTYRYNSLGRVSERTDQSGASERFYYDEEGNQILHITRDGAQISRSYQVFGNPVYERAVDREGEHPVITTYRYDSIGCLIRAVCGGHSYEYRYDAHGRLKEKRSGGKTLISYEYNHAGQIRSMTAPGGVSTHYEYDRCGRLSRLKTSGGLELKYQYDCRDRPVHLWYGNGVETCYEYDENGNLTLLETKQGEEVLLSFAYEYDGNGNRIQKRGEQWFGERGKPLSVSWRYDVRGQLLEERRSFGKEEDTIRYRYDEAGNRIFREGSEGKVFYSYNEKNQLTCEEGRQGKRLFTYSPQGSILKEEGPKGIRSYDYNSKNQQIRVTLEDGRVQKNRYDAEGLRYETCEEEKRLRFVYHEGELLYEEGGEEARSYHLGLGIEAVSRGEGISCYHRDEQRSTALMTGAGVENAYLYDAFGAEVKALEQRENRIRYTGQQYDGVTEQYYLRARYYNPVLGRFLQEDVYQGDGLNLYAYCGNNPVMYWDPSGYAKKPGSGCPPNAKINEDGGRTGESAGEEQNNKGGSPTVVQPNSGQGFSPKGYNPKHGERTFNGYVKQNANPEVALYTKSAGFNNSRGNVGGQFKRLGAEEHYGLSPHVHQPIRNVAPNGTIYGKTGKTVGVDTLSPGAKDVKQLYEYLNNGKYHQ